MNSLLVSISIKISLTQLHPHTTLIYTFEGILTSRVIVDPKSSLYTADTLDVFRIMLRDGVCCLDGTRPSCLTAVYIHQTSYKQGPLCGKNKIFPLILHV
jgi:hypothetical protein